MRFTGVVTNTNADNLEYGFNLLSDGTITNIAKGSNDCITPAQWMEADEGFNLQNRVANVHTHPIVVSKDDWQQFGLAYPSPSDIKGASCLSIAIGRYFEANGIVDTEDKYEKSLKLGMTFYNSSGVMTSTEKMKGKEYYKSINFKEFMNAAKKVVNYDDKKK